MTFIRGVQSGMPIEYADVKTVFSVFTARIGANGAPVLSALDVFIAKERPGRSFRAARAIPSSTTDQSERRTGMRISEGSNR
jgi:hypothetical protein